jgi:O-succinylbenzoic acid--CoA ligase
VAALRGSLQQGRRVPDWLRWRSSATPDSLAVKVGSLEWSYRELQEHVSLLSAVLLSKGVKQGDRVALLMSPSAHYVASIHAIARLGAVAVPFNHRNSTPELLTQLRDASPSLVVHDESLDVKAKELEGRERAKRRWESAPALFEKSASGRRDPVLGDGFDASSPHAIIYTSGSSGAPNGVELTLSNLMWNAISLGFKAGASPTDRWLLCMPLFHVGGYSILFRSVLHGSGIVLHPKFEAKRVSLSLDNDGVTLASFVPTMLTDVLEARGGKPLNPRVRLILLGGGQPPALLVTEIRKRRLPVLLTYGMTETCSLVALSNVWSSAVGPAYQAVLPSEIAVTKPGKKRRVELANLGEVGEVAVRGPTVFKGYWRQPAFTKSKFRGDWFLTGDLGVFRPSTGISILGRKEETIVSGGEKVFPAEVEAALREHPAISDAVVIGVEDSKWGQMVVAVVEPKGGSLASPPSVAELSSFLREKVGRYKIPKRYLFWPTLPRTPTGKTRRGEVRLLLERSDGAS